MVSDAFNRLTHRVLQRFAFLQQPIVLIILRPQLSTPQHQMLVFCLSCMKGGGDLRISAAIHFRYWGAGHIQENPGVV